MQSRERDPAVPFGDLVLRTPPNWTAVAFLAMLGGLHLTIGLPTLCKGRWEGYLSVVFGTLFVFLSFACYHFRSETAFLAAERKVRLRTGVSRFRCERFLPFKVVRAVRLTIESGGRNAESMIELLCPGEDVACPPSRIPRQQALFLAMLMGVPLIKVSADESPAPPQQPERLDEQTPLRRI